MRVRLNPKHWAVTEFKAGDLTLSHEPIEVSDTVGEQLLALRRKGTALVVEAEEEEATQEEVLLEFLSEEQDDWDAEEWPEDEDD